MQKGVWFKGYPLLSPSTTVQSYDPSNQYFGLIFWLFRPAGTFQKLGGLLAFDPTLIPWILKFTKICKILPFYQRNVGGHSELPWGHTKNPKLDELYTKWKFGSSDGNWATWFALDTCKIISMMFLNFPIFMQNSLFSSFLCNESIFEVP